MAGTYPRGWKIQRRDEGPTGRTEQRVGAHRKKTRVEEEQREAKGGGNRFKDLLH